MAKSNLIQVGGELVSVAKDGIVVDATAVKDYTKNMTQATVNSNVDTALTNRYTKSETYSKTQLDNLITTPEQEYETYTATSTDTSVSDILPAEGEADTIYRIGNWDGVQYDTDYYSEYAWDGTEYVHLDTKNPGLDVKPVLGSNKLVLSNGVASMAAQLSNIFITGAYISKITGKIVEDVSATNYKATSAYLKLYPGESYEAQLYYGPSNIASCYVYDKDKKVLGEYIPTEAPLIGGTFKTTLVVATILEQYPSAVYIRLSGYNATEHPEYSPYIIYPHAKTIYEDITNSRNVFVYTEEEKTLSEVLSLVPEELTSTVRFIAFKDSENNGYYKFYQIYGKNISTNGFRNPEAWLEMTTARDGLYNLTEWNDTSTTYATLADAIAAVPAKYRRVARVICYRTPTGVELAIFKTNNYASGFERTYNWQVYASVDLLNQTVHNFKLDTTHDIKDITSLKETLFKDGYLLNHDTENIFNYRKAELLRMGVSGTSGNKIVVLKNTSPWSFMFLITDNIDITKTYAWNRFDGEDLSSYVSEISLAACAGEVSDGKSILQGQYNSGFYRGYLRSSSLTPDYTHLYIFFNLKNTVSDIYEATEKVIKVLSTVCVKTQDGSISNIGYFKEYVDYYSPKNNNTYLPEDSGKTLKINAEGNVVPQTVNLTTLGGLPANMGSDNAGKILYINSVGSIVPGANTPSGVITDAVQLHRNATLYVGDDLLPGSEVTLGTGWSGSLQTGFTHTAGDSNTAPLLINYSTTAGNKYLLELTFVNNNTEGALFAAIGDLTPVDTYFGIKEVKIGFASAGGVLKFIPKNDFSNTIFDIHLSEIVEEGDSTGYREITTDNLNHGQMIHNLTGRWNVGIGTENTLKNLQNGSRNIAVGYSALQNLEEGTRNIGIGTFALSQLVAGDHNVAIGSDTLWYVKNASDNIAIGFGAFWRIYQNAQFTATGNIAIGLNAMFGPTTSAVNNIAIGNRAGKTTDASLENTIAIGHDSSAGGSNSIVIGNNISTTGNNKCKIGNSSMSFILGNKVLVFNQDGTVSWVAE